MSFSSKGLCIKIKKLHQAINNKSTSLKVQNLLKYTNGFMIIDFLNSKKDSTNEYYRLKMIKRRSGFTMDPPGTLTFTVNEPIMDSFNLDFVSFEKIENSLAFIDSSDKRAKTNGYLRLRIFQNGLLVDIHYVKIRFTKPNESDELEIVHIGYPIGPPGSNEKLIILSFKQHIAYYPDELELHNGNMPIKPFHDEKYKFPSNHIKFDMNKLEGTNFNSLTLACTTFDKFTTFYVPDIFRKIFDNRNVLYKPIKDLSLQTTKSINRQEVLYKSSNTYLQDHAQFARYRYKSEIDGNHKSGLPLNIKNLIKFVGCTFKLELIKWSSTEPHESLKFYNTKEDDNTFIIKRDGSVEVTVDLSMIRNLSLKSIGIQIEKKKNLGKEAHNCRIRMTIENETEISSVIRHLDTKLTADFEITSVSLPYGLINNAKIITLTFDRESPYFTDEFQLSNFDESIESIAQSNEGSVNFVQFDLVKFTKPLHDFIQLKCRLFNRSWTINTFYITKVLNDFNWINENRGGLRNSFEDKVGYFEVNQEDDLSFLDDAVDDFQLTGNLHDDLFEYQIPTMENLFDNMDSHTSLMNEVRDNNEDTISDGDDKLPILSYDYVVACFSNLENDSTPNSDLINPIMEENQISFGNYDDNSSVMTTPILEFKETFQLDDSVSIPCNGMEAMEFVPAYIRTGPSWNIQAQIARNLMEKRKSLKRDGGSYDDLLPTQIRGSTKKPRKKKATRDLDFLSD